MKLAPVLLLTLLLPLTAPASAIDDATARLELARVLRDDRQYDAALAEYRTLLTADPANETAAAEAAEVLVWQKQPAEARKLLEAVPEERRSAASQRVLGAIAVQAGDFAEAERRFARALELKPEDEKTRFEYAEVLTWRKKFPDAVREFRALVEKHPTDAQLRRRLARALGFAGEREAAAAEWRRSLGETKQP